MVITVECPSCSTSFPVDPRKIPAGGVKARCSTCATIFRVEPPAEEPAPSGSEPEPESFAQEPSFDPPAAVAEEEPPGESLPSDWVIERPEEEEPGVAAEAPAAEEPEAPSFASPEPSFEMPEAGFEVEPEPEPAPESYLPPPSVPEPSAPAAPEPETPAAPAAAAPVKGFTFGKRDPSEKARRLARVLVSDMIMYNPERHEKALAQGTLKEDFEDEIEKSWKEYVEQVGEEMAEGEGRGFWSDALNDVLAKGQQIF